MELRPYQKEAKEAIFEQWDSGVLKTLLVLPKKPLLPDGGTWHKTFTRNRKRSSVAVGFPLAYRAA